MSKITIEQLYKHLKDTVANEVKKVADTVNVDIKNDVRVRTGRLRDSYEVVDKKQSIPSKQVVTDVHYAVYNEFGSPTISPKPSIRNAVSRI